MRLGRAVAELRREEQRAGFTAEALCFGPQKRAVVSAHKRKVLKCGRRAGKTIGVAIKLLIEALKPPVVPALYVTLTRLNAKEIIWGELLELNDRFQLGGVPHLTDLTLTMPGGGEVKLRGANNERETAKIRGKKFKFAAIDECQSIPDRVLSPLLKDIVGPTLLDYGGELWTVGTPPPVRSGIWFELYGGKLSQLREQHHWTILDNVKLPARMAGVDIQQVLADVRAEYGWAEDDPTYLREYLGADIEDLEALLYAIPRAVEPDTTKGRWHYVFGIDIGYDDSDAIAVLGWREGEKQVHLVEEHVAAEQDVTDLALAIKALADRYHPIQMVIDQGGGGKKSVAELKRRHGLSLVPAEKTEKSTYIRMLNADLRKGMLVAPADSTFTSDCKLVRKDFEAMAREGGKLQELPASKGGYHSDICDAVLYGWRACYGWAEKAAPAPVPEPDRIEQQIEQRVKRAERWWGDDDSPGFD